MIRQDRKMALSRQLLVMVGLAVLLGFGARVVQKHPVPFWGFPKPIELVQPKAAFAGADAVSADSAFAPSDKPYDVDLSAAMGLFMKRKKAAVHFIDARAHELYVTGHVPSAVSVPFEKLADCLDDLHAIPQSELCVLYCEGEGCHLAHDLSEYMLSQGWKRIAIYTGGWDEWMEETDFVEASQ